MSITSWSNEILPIIKQPLGKVSEFISSFDSLVSIIYGLAAISLIWFGWKRFRPKGLAALITNALCDEGSTPPLVNSKQDKRRVMARVSQSISSGVPSAAEEYAWLSSCLGTDIIMDPIALKDIATSYDNLNHQLASSALRNSATIPFLSDWRETANNLSSFLHLQVGGLQPWRSIEATDYAHREISIINTDEVIEFLVMPTPKRNTTLDVSSVSSAGIVMIDGRNASSAVRERYPILEPLMVSPEVLDATERFMLENMRFEGVLSRLNNYETFTNPHNGARRLILSIGAISYSAVVADHYKRVNPDAVGASAKLLTLSLVITLLDGSIVLIRRSKELYPNGNLLCPTVNGNLDLYPWPSGMRDTGAYGFPDPRRALAREAKEELGLPVSHEEIWFTSLVKISNRDEAGTYVLCTHYAFDGTLEDLKISIRHAHPFEGGWEINDDAVLLKVPNANQKKEITCLYTWVAHSNKLASHTRATVLSLLWTQSKFFSHSLDQSCHLHPNECEKLLENKGFLTSVSVK